MAGRKDGQLGKRICAGRVRRHRTDRGTVNVGDRRAQRSGNLKHNTGDSGFGGVLTSVFIGVKPDLVTDTDRRLRRNGDDIIQFAHVIPAVRFPPIYSDVMGDDIPVNVGFRGYRCLGCKDAARERLWQSECSRIVGIGGTAVIEIEENSRI